MLIHFLSKEEVWGQSSRKPQSQTSHPSWAESTFLLSLFWLCCLSLLLSMKRQQKCGRENGPGKILQYISQTFSKPSVKLQYNSYRKARPWERLACQAQREGGLGESYCDKSVGESWWQGAPSSHTCCFLLEVWDWLKLFS